MKKNLMFILMMLFMGIAQIKAQIAWEFATESTTEIIPGEDHFYALQEGFGPFGQSTSGFLNSRETDVIQSPDNSCVYSFIPVGEKEAQGEVFKIYVLKNFANGKYLQEKNGDEGFYTANINKAFKFTARLAKEYKSSEVEGSTDWYLYSHAVMGVRESDGATPCAGAEAGHHWVLCSPEAQLYIGFVENPSFMFYYSSANWLVLDAKQRELSAFEKFLFVFSENFGTSFDSVNFPVGDDPGCISQAMFDKMNDVYQRASEATGNSNMTDEQYNALTQEIIDVFEEYKKSIIQVAPGHYYVFENYKKGFMLDNGKAYCDKTREMPKQWTVKNSSYIWKAEYAADSTRIVFRNVLTDRYMNEVDREVLMQEEPGKGYVIEKAGEKLYFIKSFDGVLIAADLSSGNVRIDKNPTYWITQWYIHSVSPEVLDTLGAKIEKERLNKELAELAARAKNDIQGLEYKNGITFNGNYSNRGAGLVSAFEQCNATEVKEGKEENAFDGNPKTYYHTAWTQQSAAPKNDWHWVQVDLGKELQEIYLKMSKRFKAAISYPTRYALVAAAPDAVEEESVWTDTLYQDTAVYTYPTAFENEVTDSSTYIAKISFKRPVQHLRFVVKATQGNKLTAGYPFWHIGEMRFYDAAETVKNPQFNLIPQEVANRLNETIDAAQKELAEGNATLATYDALQAALDEFWTAYPDPAEVIGLLEDVQKKVDYAEEDADKLGYYVPGAKAEIQLALNSMTKKVTEEVLGVTELENMKTEIKQYVDIFNKKLNVPAAGSIFLIQSTAIKDNGDPEPQTGSFISAVSTDTVADLEWHYAFDRNVMSRWNCLWLVEKNEEGLFAFKNIGTGLYADNPYDGLTEEEQEEVALNTTIRSSAAPTYFRLESSPIPGEFMIAVHNKRYVTANPSHAMTIYLNYENARSRFVFHELKKENFSSAYYVDCKENQTQIMTLPIPVYAVYTEGGEGSAYKVVGKKDNAIRLDTYQEGEIIKAGEPFVIVTVSEETQVQVLPDVLTFEELFNLNYNYEAVEKNGLVSAPRTVNPGVGYGLLVDNVVRASDEFDVVTAGTGFFNNAIPATEEDGLLSIEINGDILGEGTGIVTVKGTENKFNDVYTLAGIKVMSHISRNEAVKKLPKGIYIIGAQKVIVK